MSAGSLPADSPAIISSARGLCKGRYRSHNPPPTTSGRMLVVLALGIVATYDEEQPREISDQKRKIGRLAKAVHLERQAKSLAIMGA